MASQENTRTTLILIGGMFLVGAAMVVTIFVATRRPVVVLVPGAGAPSVAVAPPAAPVGVAAAPGAPTPMPVDVPVMRVSAAPTTDDPFDPAWSQVPEVTVPLEAQQTAPPILKHPTVAELTVQAVRDDRRIVWRLAWDAPQPVSMTNVGEFSDAVALQFPMVDGAAFTMGAPEMPVRMLYWKALWQRDVDQGFQDVADIYPHLTNDVHWFAADAQRASMTEDFDFDDPAVRQWFAGLAAGNPMSKTTRTQPIDEMVAQGFGSSTTIPDSVSTARGTWRDGRWNVVIDRPWTAGDPLIERFQQNLAQQLIAFAVFDGSAGNRGAIKHITNWIPMRIDP